MNKIKYYTFFLLFFSIFFACTVIDNNSSDSTLKVLYDGEDISSDRNIFTIYLLNSLGITGVKFTLEVGAGATLSYDNKDLPLNEYNQYITNMDFSSGKKHIFKVTAQDGDNAIYTVRVQLMDSKEISLFAFLKTDNSILEADIMMDIVGQNVTKTVTNVEGTTDLIPSIVHNGLNVFPVPKVAQDFSTNNIYTVTAINKTTSDYTVSLTSYYEVTFNPNGGLIIDSPTTTEYVFYGNTPPPPSSVLFQEHYGLKGWYDAPDGGNIFDFNSGITTKTVVYAQWTNKLYTVSFDTDGGSVTAPMTVDSLTTVTRPNDPITNHYALERWYTDNTFTAEYNFNWMVSNNLTLYAKYTNKQYQVRFYQGESLLNTVSVTSLTEIPISDYPTPTIARQSYKWYSDDVLTQPYDKFFLVTGNLDLYAEEFTPSFETIIQNGTIPFDLTDYDDMSKKIFSRYVPGAEVAVRYVAANGNGDGTSWAKANGNAKVVIDGIRYASANKIYVVLIASGTYKPPASYAMKNHVALVGGFMTGSYNRSGETRLDGNGSIRLFVNDRVDETALLYGLIITNGNSSDGGGMYNRKSSPTLINIAFLGNEAGNGGGIYNRNSSPTLINATFSGNTSTDYGGGIYNRNSSPTLINATFSGNTSTDYGGGIYNRNSSPTLINATFSGNTAGNGGGMCNIISSSPTLINATFSGNTATGNGGGIFHDSEREQFTLINTILWKNNNGNIYMVNNNSTIETVNLYYSLIEGGTNTSTSASGIRLQNSDIVTYPININSEVVITNNPRLDTPSDNGGEVDTISIDSLAKDKGIYVRGVKIRYGNPYPEANLYYSANDIDWFSDPGLNTSDTPPGDAEDLTATDARGYSRVGRPDMGAYEVGGAP